MHDKWLCHAYCWARAETCPAHPFGEHGTSQFDNKDPLAAALFPTPPASGKGNRDLSWFGSKEERGTVRGLKGGCKGWRGKWRRKRWSKRLRNILAEMERDGQQGDINRMWIRECKGSSERELIITEPMVKGKKRNILRVRSFNLYTSTTSTQTEYYHDFTF